MLRSLNPRATQEVQCLRQVVFFIDFDELLSGRPLLIGEEDEYL